MGEVYFYHMTGSTLDRALTMLVERAAKQGMRCFVRTRDPARADWLDQKLWMGPEESFLAHGLTGGPHDHLQPVLIGTGTLPEGIACLMSVDGAPVEAGEARQSARACILFDGNDPAAVGVARDQWRALTGAGLGAVYWNEEGGRWQKKAEAPARPQ